MWTALCQSWARRKAGSVGGEHLRRAAVERRQQRLFLVGEVLVEGALRGRGAVDDLGDGRRRVALLGDRRGQRPQHPLGGVARPPGAPRMAAVSASGAAAPAAGRGAGGRRATISRSAAPARAARPVRRGRGACGRPSAGRRSSPGSSAAASPRGPGSPRTVRCRSSSKVSRRLLDHGDPLGPGGVDLDEAHLRGARLGGDQAAGRPRAPAASAPRREAAPSACSMIAPSVGSISASAAVRKHSSLSAKWR